MFIAVLVLGDQVNRVKDRSDCGGWRTIHAVVHVTICGTATVYPPKCPFLQLDTLMHLRT